MIKFIKNDKSTFFFAFLILIIYISSLFVHYVAPGEADPLINLGVFLATTIAFPVIILSIENNDDLTNAFKIGIQIFLILLIAIGLYITPIV